MIEKLYSGDATTFRDYSYRLACDECMHEEEIDACDFDEVLEYMQQTGWRSIKDDEGWLNRCPDCVASRVRKDFE